MTLRIRQPGYQAGSAVLVCTPAFQANAFQFTAFQICTPPTPPSDSTFSQYGRRVGTSWNPNWNKRKKRLRVVNTAIDRTEERLEAMRNRQLAAENAALRAKLEARLEAKLLALQEERAELERMKFEQDEDDLVFLLLS